jgi:hypothetical protein
MRKALLIGALALLALPAAALAVEPAGSHQENAAKRCKAQLAAIGLATFKLTYGAQNGIGKCVSKLTREEKQNTENAAKACRAEQNDPNFAATHDGKSFADFYGKNRNDKNAFGKCVSSKAKAKSAEQQKATIKAAKDCKKARDADRAAFEARWGSKPNAFGKCVSTTAKNK